MAIKLDSIEGLVKYVEEIKPYHTKIAEILVEYIYTDCIDVTIQEEFLLDIGIPSNPEKWGWTQAEAEEFFNCSNKPFQTEYKIVSVNIPTKQWSIISDNTDKFANGDVLNFEDNGAGPVNYTIDTILDKTNNKVVIETNDNPLIGGKYFTFSTVDNTYTVWYNTGADTAPIVPGTKKIEVLAHDASLTPITNQFFLAQATLEAFRKIRRDFNFYLQKNKLTLTSKKCGNVQSPASDIGTGFSVSTEVIGRYTILTVQEIINPLSTGVGIAFPSCYSKHPVLDLRTPKSGIVWPSPAYDLAFSSLGGTGGDLCGAFGLIYQHYDAWIISEGYLIGERVEYLGNIYEASTSSTGLIPSSFPSSWTLIGRAPTFPNSLISTTQAGTPILIGSPASISLSGNELRIDNTINLPQVPGALSWEEVYLPGSKLRITGTVFDDGIHFVAGTKVEGNELVISLRDPILQSTTMTGVVTLERFGYDEPGECIKVPGQASSLQQIARTFIHDRIEFDWECDFFQFGIISTTANFVLDEFTNYTLKIFGDARFQLPIATFFKIVGNDNLGIYQVSDIDFDGTFTFIEVSTVAPYLVGTGWIEPVEPLFPCGIGSPADFIGPFPLDCGSPQLIGSPSVNCGTLDEPCLELFGGWNNCGWNLQNWN